MYVYVYVHTYIYIYIYKYTYYCKYIIVKYQTWSSPIFSVSAVSNICLFCSPRIFSPGESWVNAQPKDAKKMKKKDEAKKATEKKTPEKKHMKKWWKSGDNGGDGKWMKMV